MQNIFLDQINKIRMGDRFKCVGICSHLMHPEMSGVFDLDQVIDLRDEFYDYEREVLDFLKQCFESWPFFSGCLNYPVPLNDRNPMWSYTGTEDMWIGEYGENRLKLLDHIEKCYIEEFKIEVRS